MESVAGNVSYHMFLMESKEKFVTLLFVFADGRSVGRARQLEFESLMPDMKVIHSIQNFFSQIRKNSTQIQVKLNFSGNST